MKLNLRWMEEAITRDVDRNCGAQLTQITSAALISHNIYCEERYTDTEGRYLAFLRSALGQESEELWLHQTKTTAVARLSDAIYGYPTSSIYSDALYYVRRTASAERVLTRVDFKSLEQEDVFDLSACPSTRYPVATVSPDDRYFVGNCRVCDNIWGLYRCDLQKGGWEIFHEHEGICNPHHQFEPSRGQDILVQWNRGCVADEEDNVTSWADELGTTLYVIDRDGNNERPLPIGAPLTGRVTGHECWLGTSHEIILTTHGANGNEIHLAAPHRQYSRCLWNGLGFNHISVSSDGRFWITDDTANGRIYIGCLATGRMLPFCDTGTSYGSPQYCHPHAYMTPDNRRVIFNSDRTGLGQVWCADVPRGFLEALALPLS